MKKKNPFSQLLNHKLLHKLGKQWVVISATLLMFLSGGALMTHSVDAAQLNPAPVQAQQTVKPSQNPASDQSAAITQDAEQMHQRLLQNNFKPTVNHQAHPTVKAPQDLTAYHYQRSTRYHKGYRKMRKQRTHRNRNQRQLRQRSSRRRNRKTRRRANQPIRHRSRKNRRNVKNRSTKQRVRRHTNRINRNSRQHNRKRTLRRTRRNKSARKQLRRRRQRRTVRRSRHQRRHQRRAANDESRTIAQTSDQPQIKTAANYLAQDKNGSYYYFTSDGYNSLKNLSDENFGDLTSADDASDPTPVTIEQKDNCHGYDFDQIKTSDNGNVWVPSAEVTTDRQAKNDDWQIMNQMFNNLDQQYLQQNYSSDEISTINNLRSQYNYLLHNEDSSNYSDMANYRQRVIDCLNYYRNLEGLPSVTENSDYDARAQAAANSQHDLEDMNWGTSEPLDEINSYYTDQNDLDRDGKAGHRSSILNPGAVYVGVGQNSDVNALFLNWGQDGSDNRIVKYPAQGPFSYSDAVNGEYWSIHDPDFNGTPSDTITVTVKDLTDNSDITPTNLTFYDQDVYYRIPKSDIQNGHKYYIKMQDSNGAYVWYITKLFSLSPNFEPQ